MKKFPFLYVLLALFCCAAPYAVAEDELSAAMPLLQASHRNTAQNQQVLNLFAQSKNPSVVFAAGASLVRIPPAQVQEAKLFNLVIKSDDVLKKVFSAIILTAMGNVHEELSPMLQDAISSEDHAVRSYAASAYSIINPQETYKAEIINLYIYDAAFAQRAMNLISSSDKQTLKFLREAAKNEDGQVRAAAATWLGDLQNKEAAKHLLKMAKTELDAQTSSAIAVGLAKNRQWTQEEVIKGLKTPYASPKANTYALALGFMTGNAIEPIKQALLSENENERINAARAAAYMAGVLASVDASLYSSDTAFDTTLLRGLIAQLAVMSKKDKDSVKVYADNALKQIAKLK